MPRLLLCFVAVALATGPFLQTAAAGSARVVLHVTARVVSACSVTVPPAHSRGRGTPPVDHRCVPGIPDHASPVGPSKRGGGLGRVTVEPGQGAAPGGVTVVTVTY